jgi:hypothetical protein
MIVEKEIDEIGRMRKSKKQIEDGMKSRNIEDWIGNSGRTCGITIMESRNVKADGESLRPVGVGCGMSAEVAIRSKDVQCRRRQGR